MDKNALSQEAVQKICTKKLKTDCYKILKADLTLYKEKMGLLGDHATLKILTEKGSGEEELVFFVKLFPSIPVAAEFAERSGAFNKEIFVNEILIKRVKESGIELIGDCVPECYFTNETVLVFDHLVEEGYRIMDKYEEYDYGMILTVLKSLAKFHACSLIYEETMSKSLDHEYRLIDEYGCDFEESLYSDKPDFINQSGVKASIKAILTEIDIFEQPATLSSGENFKEVAEKCCFKLYELVKPSGKLRNVISHGDLWSSNIFLKFKSGAAVGCKFVDFQHVRYAPPAHDVMSALHLNTSRKFREEHMYELVGLYYAALESHLKLAGLDANELAPFSDFLQSCEEQKLFALVQSATYFQLILLDEDSLTELYADPDGIQAALFEDRSSFILKYVDKLPFYKRKLEESIKDLKEFCEKF